VLFYAQNNAQLDGCVMGMGFDGEPPASHDHFYHCYTLCFQPSVQSEQRDIGEHCLYYSASHTYTACRMGGSIQLYMFTVFDV